MAIKWLIKESQLKEIALPYTSIFGAQTVVIKSLQLIEPFSQVNFHQAVN